MRVRYTIQGVGGSLYVSLMSRWGMRVGEGDLGCGSFIKAPFTAGSTNKRPHYRTPLRHFRSNFEKRGLTRALLGIGLAP